MTTTTFSLYTGRVTRVETTRNGKWHIIHVKDKSKPLAVDVKGFEGELPKVGDKINVQASEGKVWFFSQHRSMVIVQEEPYYSIEDLPNANATRTEKVIALIRREFQRKDQITSDDIFDAAMSAVGNYMEDGRWNIDPRFIGHAFHALSQIKEIHKVATRKSERIKFNHARDLSVWELTKKGLKDSERVPAV